MKPSESRRAPWGSTSALVAFVLVAALLRMAALGADPPSWMEEAYFVDGGWWAASARAAHATGDPTNGDFGMVYALFPLYTWLLEQAFALFGLASASQRGLSAAASVVATAVAVWLARHEGSREIAGFCAVLLALSPFYFAQGNAELPDPIQGAFAVTSFALLVLRGRGWLLGFAAGLAMGGAVAVKPTAIATGGLAMALTCLAQLELARRRGESLRPTVVRAAGAIAGLGVAAVALLALHVIPQRELVFQALGVSPESYQLGWARALANPGLALLSKSLLEDGWWPATWRVLTYSPAIFLGAWCFALSIAAAPDGARRAFRRLPELERGALAWCVGWSLPIVLAPAQPDYRYTALVPLLAILAASGLASAATSAEGRAAATPRRVVAVGLAALLLLPLLLPLKAWLTALALEYGQAIPLGDEPGLDIASAGAVATAACAVVVGLGAAFPASVARGARALRGFAAVALVAAALLVEALLVARHLAARSESLVAAQARLVDVLPAGATVAAPLASSALLPAPVHVVRRLDAKRAPLDLRSPDWDAMRPRFFLFPVVINFVPWRPGAEVETRLAARGYRLRETLSVAPAADGSPRFVLRLLEDEGAGDR